MLFCNFLQVNVSETVTIETSAVVRKPLVEPNSHVDRHSDTYDRLQSADNVDFQHVDNFPPVISVKPEEPSTRPDSTSMSQKQNDGRQKQDVVGDVTGPQTADYSGDNVYVNFAEKHHSDQWNGFPPETRTGEDDYLVPVTGTEDTQLKDSVSRKDSIRHWDQVALDKDNPQNDWDCSEDNVYMTVDDVRASAVMEEDGAASDVTEKPPVVILRSESVNKGQTDVAIARESAASMPVYDDVYDGKISDARRRKSTDRSLQPAFTGSISLGEVITDTVGTNAWTDLDTAAESVAAVPLYDIIHEDEAGRRKSSDKSPDHLRPVFARSMSNGEIVIDGEGALDIFESEAPSQMVQNAGSSAPSKTVAVINPGILTHVLKTYFSLLASHLFFTKHFPLTLLVVLTTLSHYCVSVWYYASFKLQAGDIVIRPIWVCWSICMVHVFVCFLAFTLICL